MNALNNPVTDNAELICSAMVEAKRVAILAEKLASLAEHIAENPSVVEALRLAESDIVEAGKHVNGIELFYTRLSADLPLVRD
ncbi:hypothetical protein [Endozoicomonas sp. SESOKO1]|uniref:hypothetical protein n=1 Tax=Endozoicomonas sp. SESOKO1 TaxID=2828742 RepID=UPI00214884E9|nr:hypothetical protein [Endozoicomonas sp. SESOKO1]